MVKSNKKRGKEKNLKFYSQKPFYTYYFQTLRRPLVLGNFRLQILCGKVWRHFAKNVGEEYDIVRGV